MKGSHSWELKRRTVNAELYTENYDKEKLTYLKTFSSSDKDRGTELWQLKNTAISYTPVSRNNSSER